MTGHIFIYGGIGLDKREREISSEDVRQQIEENKAANELVVHLMSPGGDVFEGEAIYNALKNSGKQITTHIEGTCASIATLIAAAGSKVIMNKTARFMIHNPKISGMTTAADSRDLRHVADQLDQIKTLLINVYLNKTGLGKEKLWELYDNETWLTAEQAEQMGFIDESVDAIKAVAKVDLKHLKMATKTDKSFWTQFKNLLHQFKNETATLQDGTVIQVMSEDGEWTGKQVMTEDGSPLAAGEHPLQDGRVLVVDASGIITEVKEAAAPSDQQDNDMQNKIKELEAQLAEAKAAKDTAEASVKALQTESATAKAKAIKFENRVTEIEKQFLKLQEEAGKTVGDTTPPSKGPTFKNSQEKETQMADPMGQEVLKYFRNRNIITQNED